MNQKIKNLTELRFGGLVVARFAGMSKRSDALWHTICDCGSLSVKMGNAMLRKTKPLRTCSHACPLGSSITHGMSRSPIYRVWASMVERCTKSNNKKFKDYGGRGIQVCERWRSFGNFLSDMGRRPTLKHTLERIDNGKGYEPDNCKWATRRENAFNKRNNRLTVEQADTAIAHELCLNTVRARISRGWGIEAAISTPTKKQKATT